MSALRDTGVSDEERERQALSFFKATTILEFFAFIELLSEKCDLDAEDIKMKSVMLCDELNKRETDRWIRDNPGEYRRLLPRRPHGPPPNW